eukprot:CAMPEP_0181522708 /NCGR_PEP_ID=MMETSP1110-20121109/67517_1 /TAXON_ID=174948 /ORGANISM="Symbiodinium sp., Strain CCMP421" /LENGTH=90 /DNA_ID=CAMNT_0023653341 /DNA_START=231 /DNA_END=500 /DNA_ORIENTATION=+
MAHGQQRLHPQQPWTALILALGRCLRHELLDVWETVGVEELQEGFEGTHITVLDHDDFRNAFLHPRGQLLTEHLGSRAQDWGMRLEHFVL